MLKQRIWKQIVISSLCACIALFTFLTVVPAQQTHAASSRSTQKHDSLVHTSTMHSDCVSNAIPWVWKTGFYMSPGSSYITQTCSGTSIKLIYQYDNNLVLYIGRAAKWASGTFWNGNEIKPDYVEFQPDGNLVVYSYVLRGNYYYVNALWASGTSGEGATNLDLQIDGNLVIYKNNSMSPSSALWASGTCCYS